jgi:amino acid permease
MSTINWKLLIRASSAVVILILALWVARGYGGSDYINSIIRVTYSVFIFPALVIVLFGVPDETLPTLFLLIVVSAVVWGVLVERLVWAFRGSRVRGE